MRNNKKKGFTLIELLAVIVILAIVALIATPIVLNLINTAKKGAFKRSAENVLKSSKLYYSSSLLETSGPKNIIFNCDNNECTSSELDEKGNTIKLDIDGTMGSGTIMVKSDGNVLFTLTNNKYCAVKYENNPTVKLVDGNCSNIDLTNDTTPPEISSVTIDVTTNSIQVTVGAKDEESGIYGFQYSIDGGATYTDFTKNTMHPFEGLTNDNNKKYNVKVRVCNGTYGKNTGNSTNPCSEKEFEKNPIKLKTLKLPTINVISKGYVSSDSKWSTEKEVTIDYYGALIKEYKIESGTATKEDGTVLENNKVYSTNNDKETVIFTSNGAIIAIASDGDKFVNPSANIINIDNEKPTVKVSDINTSYEKQDEITLTLNDTLSGVTHYCVTSESVSDNCNWISGSGMVTHTINTNGTYYAYSKDAVENISEGKEFAIDKIDTEDPTASLELESKTTNSITVKATCTDNVGITTYEYSYNNGVKYDPATSNDTYTFSGLTTGTYNLKVRCSDEAGNSAIGNVIVDTEDLEKPDITVSNSEVWSTSKTVTIDYKDTTNINEYQIINGTATKEDGTVLTLGTWYQTSNKEEKVIFTSDGNIVARKSDGKNTVKATSQLVSNIEAVNPTDMTLSINSDTTYAKTKSVTVTLKDTGGSGLAAGSVKYGWSTSTSIEPSSYTAVSTSATSGTDATTFTANGSGLTGSYYLWVVPTNYKDNAGNSNTTTVKSTGTFTFDNESPTLSVTAGDDDFKQSYNAIITISDTGGSGLAAGSYKIYYGWGPVDDMVCDNLTSYITITVTEGASSASGTVTVSGATGKYNLYACNKGIAIKDVAGNSYAANHRVADHAYLDNTAPTLSVTAGDDDFKQSYDATITISDTGGSGLAAGSYKIYYGWGPVDDMVCDNLTSYITITAAGESSASGTVTVSGETGKYNLYACNKDVAIKDVAGNSYAANHRVSAHAYLDNTVPELELGTASATKNSITVPYTASDSHSEIDTTTCEYGKSTSYGSTGTISSGNCVMSGLSSSTTYYYKVTTTDKAGNSTYKTGSKKTMTYNTGDAVILGGYNWHVIGDTGTNVTLLMDAGQVSNMAHCSSVNNSSNNCTFNGTYYVYSWDKSLIRTYLNSTFLSELESKISNEIVKTSICADPSKGDGSTTYGGYLMSELDALGKTSSCSNTVSDKVRLITYSEYYNMSPYYTTTSTSYPNVGNITKISSDSDYASWLYCSSSSCGNSSGYWWTMGSYSNSNTDNVNYVRYVNSAGSLKYGYGSSGVRPVVTIVK